MDYRLVLSNLRFFDLQFWVTVDNYISCHGFPEITPEQKYSLNYQYYIFSKKTKVTQFARSCRITTCLFIFLTNLPICIVMLLQWYPTYQRMIYESVGRKQLFPGTFNIKYLVHLKFFSLFSVYVNHLLYIKKQRSKNRKK